MSHKLKSNECALFLPCYPVCYLQEFYLLPLWWGRWGSPLPTLYCHINLASQICQEHLFVTKWLHHLQCHFPLNQYPKSRKRDWGLSVALGTRLSFPLPALLSSFSPLARSPDFPLYTTIRIGSHGHFCLHSWEIRFFNLQRGKGVIIIPTSKQAMCMQRWENNSLFTPHRKPS